MAAGRPPDPAGAAVAPFPARRSWGFAVQLYSVRSRASWGHGDLHDLADLASWSGGDLGADFVLVNPLHAAEPQPPVSPSPYLPMSRRQISPLYLRIEDIPEYQGLSAGDRARVEALAAPLRAASTSTALIDRDAVWAAKRAALELIRAVPLTAGRRAELDAFLARDRRAIDDWAAWCAIAEVHGPDWRSWPAALADPGSAEVTELRRALADRIEFHAWLQWLAAEQLAAAQQAARRAGMSIGVITDLAVGAHPGGADAWARQDVIVPGISVGAPPDEFNQRGQNWTLPPWHPGWLAAQAGRPLAELIGANTRARRRPARGPRHGTGPAVVDTGRDVPGPGHLRALRPRADGRRAGRRGGPRGRAGDRRGPRHGRTLAAEVPGRPPGARYLHAVVRAPGGWHAAQAGRVAPRLPGHGRHARHAAGRGVPHRRAGHHPGQARPADPAGGGGAGRRRAEMARWLAMLGREGLLARQAGGRRRRSSRSRSTRYLTRTPAVLIGVSLADAAGERRPQNMPGTVDEYPNWRVPLADADGQPVLLEDLPAHAGVRAVAAAVSGGLRR